MAQSVRDTSLPSTSALGLVLTVLMVVAVMIRGRVSLLAILVGGGLTGVVALWLEHSRLGSRLETVYDGLGIEGRVVAGVALACLIPVVAIIGRELALLDILSPSPDEYYGVLLGTGVALVLVGFYRGK